MICSTLCISPVEIPKMTIPQFMAIISCGKIGESPELTREQTLAYVRKQQREMFGRKL